MKNKRELLMMIISLLMIKWIVFSTVSWKKRNKSKSNISNNKSH